MSRRGVVETCAPWVARKRNAAPRMPIKTPADTQAAGKMSATKKLQSTLSSLAPYALPKPGADARMIEVKAKAARLPRLCPGATWHSGASSVLRPPQTRPSARASVNATSAMPWSLNNAEVT